MRIDTATEKTRVEYDNGSLVGSIFVIVHGWGGSSASREPVAQLLVEQGHSVYRLDVPGFGQTKMSRTYNVEDYADWLESVIVSLGLTTYSLLGHSNGGRIAVAFAARQPVGLQKLLLNNAAGIKRRPSLKRSVLGVLARWFRWSKRLPFVGKLRVLFYKMIGGHDYIALDSSSSIDTTTNYKKETFHAMICSDLSERMHAITVETHLIRGEKDTYTPLRQGKEMHQYITGSTIDILDGQRHGIHLHEPKLLVSTILNYE